jgi:hypothetical protein
MSDAPKFEVIDRRKMKAQEEQTATPAAEQEKEPEKSVSAPEPSAGPHLVRNEPQAEQAEQQEFAEAQTSEMPQAPTAEESSKQKAAYDASAQRIEDLIRAQNPGAGAQPPVTFEQLVQQFYVSGLIQMGAGTPEGQQPRVDIMGARNMIDLMGVLAEKTHGNLTPTEDRMMQAALYELRMAFLELSGMISLPGVPPPKAKQ